ncbi:NUDIX domain-containing protein [Dactylosporangium sp. AC04546]|uniref:NUDIX hydrolase n=1 Tax=Dactylosporangium sp. AC04546 TaxID=2862460 RepID=UPI001EE0C223|nr:NUDIX domain-containing protein [Dactylosporangium sp. AC04546]WVK89553.1 NUDIX domain-containing protein [Dactylosporangium sp. AC04546]
MVEEAEFLASYDPRAYPPVAVTVDVVAFTIRQDELTVLLVRRACPPSEGMWALPGGFVREWEDLATAAARELAEETGVATAHRRLHLEQLGTYGAPDRDPRMRVVSVAYLAFAPHLPDPVPGSDARVAAWTPVHEATELAFDHATILADGLERARSKLEYTPLATRFVDDEFTIADLRGVYEIVWGEPLHAGNFHRKVLSVPGFVESTGAMTERGGARGGPRAKLYRAGDARLLHPALLMPSREETVR